MQSLWMLVASLLFASMGVCVKLAATKGFSAGEIVFYRSVISLLLLFPIIRWTRVSLVTAQWRGHLLRSLSGFAALALYFWAITLLPLATAVTLNYTAPIFLALLLVWVGQEAIGLRMVTALLLGLLGVVALLHPTLRSEQLWGGVIGLVSGVLAAVAYFNVRELGARGEPEVRTVFYFTLISSLCGLFGLFFSELHTPDLAGALTLLGVGGFATVAQLAMTRAYRRGKPLVSATLAYTTVVFSSWFGAIIWGETLSWDAWMAVGLISLSGILAHRRVPLRVAK